MDYWDTDLYRSVFQIKCMENAKDSELKDSELNNAKDSELENKEIQRQEGEQRARNVPAYRFDFI